MCGCNGLYGYCVNELIFKMEINGLKLIKIPCPFSLGLMETMIRAHCDLHISAFNIGECSLYIWKNQWIHWGTQHGESWQWVAVEVYSDWSSEFTTEYIKIKIPGLPGFWFNWAQMSRDPYFKCFPGYPNDHAGVRTEHL